MTDPLTEAAEAAHRAYLSDMQDCVDDAYAVVKAADFAAEGLHISKWPDIAFDLVLRAMLADLRGPEAGESQGDPHGVA